MTLTTDHPVAGLTLDHHRPRYHVRPPRGYLNDPNGPIVTGGVAHLYFQSRFTTDLSEPVHWGHATSPDFARWKLHRPALSPVPDGLDADGCWSGNTVLDGDRVRAFYSGLTLDSPHQSVLSAVSADGGFSFSAPTLALPDPAPDEQVVMYRDPFVWRADGRWHLIVGVGYAPDRGAIRAYQSTDLEHWTRVDDLAGLPRQVVAGEDTGTGWECPQLLDLDGVNVAVIGSWVDQRPVNQVLAFRVDTVEAPQRVDHGPNFYAASVLRETEFGPLIFGWLTEGRARSAWVAAGWAGVLSLPRQVWLAADGSLRSAPVPSLTGLRSGSARPADQAVVDTQFEVVVPSAPGRIELRFGPDERLAINLDDAAGTISVDRSAASLDPNADGGVATVGDAFDTESGRPAARVFVDGSVVEVFTSSGRVLSTRIYPTNPPPWELAAAPNCELWVLE